MEVGATLFVCSIEGKKAGGGIAQLAGHLPLNLGTRVQIPVGA